APPGGFTVNLDSSNSTQVQLSPDAATPGSGHISINVAAGQVSSASFVVTGKLVTQDAQGDHPVTIKASVSDGSWQSSPATTGQVNVRATKLFVNGVNGVSTPRTTQSAPDPYIYAQVLCDYYGTGSYYNCGVMNTDLAVTFGVDAQPLNMVTLSTTTPPQSGQTVTVTMPANSNSTQNAYVTADRPTLPGTYQVTVSAQDVAGSSSGVVTVTQPHIRDVTSKPVGVGEHSTDW